MLPFFIENHEIGQYSGYKTQVQARYFFEISTIEDIQKLSDAYIFANKNSLPFLIIGGGTNLLFSRSKFPGVVVKNSITGWEYNLENSQLHAYSSEGIWHIAQTLEDKYEQPIWHRFIGLPGSIGGAVFGNAGCFGLETESNFLSANIYDMKEGVYKKISYEEMGFSYRYSVLKENPNYFLLDVQFDLSEKKEKYSSDVDNIYFREHRQPQGNCCGSFFKNPSRDVSAGMLIEKVGLKGYHHGSAFWSDIHANFLMSEGELSSGKDLLKLVELTIMKVKKETGYELVNEVKIIL